MLYRGVLWFDAAGERFIDPNLCSNCANRVWEKWRKKFTGFVPPRWVFLIRASADGSDALYEMMNGYDARSGRLNAPPCHQSPTPGDSDRCRACYPDKVG